MTYKYLFLFSTAIIIKDMNIAAADNEVNEPDKLDCKNVKIPTNEIKDKMPTLNLE
jgi:hypothetical protein